MGYKVLNWEEVYEHSSASYFQDAYSALTANYDKLPTQGRINSYILSKYELSWPNFEENRLVTSATFPTFSEKTKFTVTYTLARASSTSNNLIVTATISPSLTSDFLGTTTQMGVILYYYADGSPSASTTSAPSVVSSGITIGAGMSYTTLTLTGLTTGKYYHIAVGQFRGSVNNTDYTYEFILPGNEVYLYEYSGGGTTGTTGTNLGELPWYYVKGMLSQTNVAGMWYYDYGQTNYCYISGQYSSLTVRVDFSSVGTPTYANVESFNATLYDYSTASLKNIVPCQGSISYFPLYNYDNTLTFSSSSNYGSFRLHGTLPVDFDTAQDVGAAVAVRINNSKLVINGNGDYYTLKYAPTTDTAS